MIYALAGDIFFTRSRSLLGRLIRWAETDPNEPNGVWANHVGVVVSPGWIVPPPLDRQFAQAIAVEALWRAERWNWWDNHKNEVGLEIRVYRKPNLNFEQLRRIEAEAYKYVGAKYGWWKLFAHLVDRTVFKGKKTVSNLLYIDGRPICSYLAAHVFAAGGVSFGMPPAAADPDEMMDHCEHSGEWVLVGGSKIGDKR